MQTGFGPFNLNRFCDALQLCQARHNIHHFLLDTFYRITFDGKPVNVAGHGEPVTARPGPDNNA